jgi:NADP-dependent 3-hydroxy acid dehydrogenase YdfG
VQQADNTATADVCRGIGHGLVKKLLERSNKVIATARVPQDAQQLQQLAAENSNLIVTALDVSQPDSITQFAAEVKKHTQHVDVSGFADHYSTAKRCKMAYIPQFAVCRQFRQRSTLNMWM